MLWCIDGNISLLVCIDISGLNSFTKLENRLRQLAEYKRVFSDRYSSTIYHYWFNV